MKIDIVLGKIRYLLGKILGIFSTYGFIDFPLIILCIIPGLTFNRNSEKNKLSMESSGYGLSGL